MCDHGCACDNLLHKVPSIQCTAQAQTNKSCITIACIHVLGGGGGLLGVGVGVGGGCVDVFAKGAVCQGSGVKHHTHKLNHYL